MNNNERKTSAMHSILLFTVATMSLALVPAATAETHTVVAYGGFFAPEEVVVRSGDTIDWQHAAGNHTVTSGDPCTADGLFDSPLNGGNPTFTWTVPANASGTIAYFCDPHCSTGMVGTIRVIDEAAVLDVPGDYPTIADAIDAANVDDIIYIAAGTYYETNLTLGAADITLRGEANARWHTCRHD